VLTASDDKTARLWDAETGRPTSPPLQHQGAVSSAEFSPDGQCVVTVSADKTARLWDTQTGQPISAPLHILNEARLDTAAGRYAKALAKHLWFHENALKYQPSLYGVRLSHALADWIKLGSLYPAALDQLHRIGDDAAQKVRGDQDCREAFHVFAAINRAFGNPAITRDLFVWLHDNRPSSANALFDLAQPALVEAKEYHLCGPYIDPAAAFQRIAELYRGMEGLGETAGSREAQALDVPPMFNAVMKQQLQELSRVQFCNDSVVLVAILALNGRQTDADRIATDALNEFDDPQLREDLDQARKGRLPPPRPDPID